MTHDWINCFTKLGTFVHHISLPLLLSSPPFSLMLAVLVQVLLVLLDIQFELLLLSQSILRLRLPRTHRLLNATRKISRREQVANHNSRKKALRRQLSLPFDGDLGIFDRTGLFEDTFFEYYDRIKLKLVVSRPRGSGWSGRQIQPTRLHPVGRLLLVLQFLRHHETYTKLSLEYKLSKSAVCREIRHLVPIILASLNELPAAFPTTPKLHEFEGVIGALDCTSHFRWRVHPGQADWYRADYHAFFTTGMRKNISKYEN
jgi:hypothetical protein